MDVLTSEQRRRNMSAVRSANTKPELIIRRGLHRLGFRYCLNDRRLPGTPDLVLPKYGVAIFIHGCFWHGHDCNLFKSPKTRPQFWQAKIDGNRHRDASAHRDLALLGWRVLTIWECCLRGPDKLPIDEVLRRCHAFLVGRSHEFSISCAKPQSRSHAP